MKPATMLLVLALSQAGTSGCWFLRPPTPPAPQFVASPTQQNILDRINGSARIRQLQAESARITASGMLVPLQANLAIERPRRLRLQGQLFGAGGVDLGSNDELLWMWTSLARPPAVYYARHEDFQRSAAAQAFPFRPEWLIEALGVVTLDPSMPVEGPYPRGSGQLEIRTRVPGVQGEMTKIFLVDATYGWILHEYLYDSRGQLVAKADMSDHRYYNNVDVSLPHHVEIELPQSGATITVDVSGYLINQLHGDPEQLWSPPHIDGAPLVDIISTGNLPQLAQPQAAPPQYPPPNYGAAPSAARPQYRGFPGR